ncbi:MAG: hypothetical protein E5X43_35075, partial [Mesorhizobium sp.]
MGLKYLLVPVRSPLGMAPCFLSLLVPLLLQFKLQFKRYGIKPLRNVDDLRATHRTFQKHLTGHRNQNGIP